MYLNENFRRNAHCGNESGGVGRGFDVVWELRMVGVRGAGVGIRSNPRREERVATSGGSGWVRAGRGRRVGGENR